MSSAEENTRGQKINLIPLDTKEKVLIWVRFVITSVGECNADNEMLGMIYDANQQLVAGLNDGEEAPPRIIAAMMVKDALNRAELPVSIGTKANEVDDALPEGWRQVSPGEFSDDGQMYVPLPMQGFDVVLTARGLEMLMDNMANLSVGLFKNGIFTAQKAMNGEGSDEPTPTTPQPQQPPPPKPADFEMDDEFLALIEVALEKSYYPPKNEVIRNWAKDNGYVWHPNFGAYWDGKSKFPATPTELIPLFEAEDLIVVRERADEVEPDADSEPTEE